MNNLYFYLKTLEIFILTWSFLISKGIFHSKSMINRGIQCYKEMTIISRIKSNFVIRFMLLEASGPVKACNGIALPLL
jgi:hypothetical protein